MNHDTVILYQGGDGKIANQKYIVATVYGWQRADAKNKTKVFAKYAARAANLTIDEALDLANDSVRLASCPTLDVGEKIS